MTTAKVSRMLCKALNCRTDVVQTLLLQQRSGPIATFVNAHVSRCCACVRTLLTCGGTAVASLQACHFELFLRYPSPKLRVSTMRASCVRVAADPVPVPARAGLMLQVLTYNADQRVFGYVRVNMQRDGAGNLDATVSIDAMPITFGRALG